MEMLGEAIRKKRITKGYSQQYVADSINVSQSTFNRIENGRSEISVQNSCGSARYWMQTPLTSYRAMLQTSVDNKSIEYILLPI